MKFLFACSFIGMFAGAIAGGVLGYLAFDSERASIVGREYSVIGGALGYAPCGFIAGTFVGFVIGKIFLNAGDKPGVAKKE